MGITRPKPEEIVVKLRQVEVLTGQGIARLDAIRQIGVTEQTYYRWKKKYGGMGTEQLKELKRLQKENITGIRNKAIPSLGCDFLARRSELVTLKTSDIDFLRSGVIRSIIRRIKNDQFSEGRLVYGSKRSSQLLKT